MCKVYNSIGSLTAIKSHLRASNVNEFKTLRELINFQKNYSAAREQIIAQHSLLIEQEKNTLGEEIAQLHDSINATKSRVEQELQLELEKLQQELDDLPSHPSNILHAFTGYFKKRNIKKRIRNNGASFNFIVKDSVQELENLLIRKTNRHRYVISHFRNAIDESSFSQLRELERKKKIIDQINTSIYGAFGEQKVVKELENLSDEYILINDFTCSFHPPIYNRQEDDHIRSIQIDHLLISPAGIFLIETKNWSEHSINNASLRSPVQQIKRTNFALFRILAGKTTNFKLALEQHHWGSRKIPVKNLIVLIKQKPSEEFQYVKVLTLEELLRYVKYFKPCLTSEDTQRIANYLLSLNRSIE